MLKYYVIDFKLYLANKQNWIIVLYLKSTTEYAIISFIENILKQ